MNISIRFWFEIPFKLTLVTELIFQRHILKQIFKSEMTLCLQMLDAPYLFGFIEVSSL